MSISVLEKIFGGQARVRLMQLFLFNADGIFDKEEIIKKTKISADASNKEILALIEIGLVKRKIFSKIFELKTGTKKKRIIGYTLNKNFVFINHLKNFLINTVPLQKNNLVKKISKICNPKLILVSGIFLQVDESRIDLLIVADNVKEGTIKIIVNQIESEIGKEIRYTVFNSEDFKYRVSLHDHLIRDIFDLPHQILINKLGL
jgi:hypothetical protein